MFIKKRGVAIIVLSLLLSLLVSGPAFASAPLVIDHFDVFDEISLQLGGTTSGSSVTADPSALGGERDAEAAILGGSSGELALRTNANNDSLLSHSQDAGILGWSRITWDGADGDAATLDPVGLRNGGASGEDLTHLGTHDSVQLGVEFDDLPATVTIDVYTDGANWSRYLLNLPGGVFAPTAYDIPFTDFVVQSGSGADFANVGAVVLKLDGSAAPGLDLRIHFLQTGDNDDAYDFGDLPAAYNNTLTADSGASHLIGGLYLGLSVDGEADGQESANADGDDAASFPDEDGVFRTPGFNWSVAGGGSIDIWVSGCSGTCYLSGWIDWLGDNDFADGGENVLLDQPVVNGFQTITFPIPAGTTFSRSFFARFRLYENSTGGTASPLGVVSNGEVEDYSWGFGPTAVRLASVSATASSELPVTGLVAVGLLVISAVGAFVIFRPRPW